VDKFAYSWLPLFLFLIEVIIATGFVNCKFFKGDLLKIDLYLSEYLVALRLVWAPVVNLVYGTSLPFKIAESYDVLYGILFIF
jgi:hypothetical protein